MSGRVKYARKPKNDDPICRTRRCLVCQRMFRSKQFIYTCEKCKNKSRGKHSRK